MSDEDNARAEVRSISQAIFEMLSEQESPVDFACALGLPGEGTVSVSCVGEPEDLAGLVANLLADAVPDQIVIPGHMEASDTAVRQFMALFSQTFRKSAGDGIARLLLEALQKTIPG